MKIHTIRDFKITYGKEINIEPCVLDTMITIFDNEYDGESTILYGDLYDESNVCEMDRNRLLALIEWIRNGGFAEANEGVTTLQFCNTEYSAEEIANAFETMVLTSNDTDIVRTSFF